MIRRFRGLKTHQLFFAVAIGFLSGLYVWTPLFEDYKKDKALDKTNEIVQDGKTS